MDVLLNKPKKSYRKDKQESRNDLIAQHGKVPPQAIDVEEAVLGALMLEKHVVSSVIDILKVEVFYKEAHGKIFKAIQDLHMKGDPIDIITVTNQLKTSNELDFVGGAYYVTKLTNQVGSTANVEYHSRILLQKYLQRELIGISSEAIKEAFDPACDVFNLMGDVDKELGNLATGAFKKDGVLIGNEIGGTWEKACTPVESGFTGVPSGFTALDRITNGWQKSDLIVIAARPGMGKTAFVLTLAKNLAVEHGGAVAFFSLEMSNTQLQQRLLSIHTEIPIEDIRKQNVDSTLRDQKSAKVVELLDAPIFIDDTPALSILEFRAKAIRLKNKYNLELIIVDYLQLMRADGANNREQEISTISRTLKAVAKELDIPIIALSQLNRSVETRGGSKKPMLSDLRESGAIEQDTDMVLFIYRPEYYKIYEDDDGNPTQGIAEINVAKFRNGSPDDMKLRFIGKTTSFKDYDEKEVEKWKPDQLPPMDEFENDIPRY